jgi:hypothetical protein
LSASLKSGEKRRLVAELADDEKIVTSHGEVLSKFSSQADLKEFCHGLDQGKEKRLSREQYKKLWSWIGTKEKAGDDYFERKERRSTKRRTRSARKRLKAPPE